MASPLSHPRLMIIIVSAFMALVLLNELTATVDTDRFSSRIRSWNTHIDPQLTEVNSTLGFEKVFVVNLPERSDKRDSMSLAAGLSNISIEYVDGVKGQSIPDKALPAGREQRDMPENMLGSWRAHMNAIRTVVEQGLSSALIVEDDSDWDVRVKQQLANFAMGARWLQGTTHTDKTHSPYGDDWDVLWVGTCKDDIAKDNQRSFVIQDDVTAADYHKLYQPWEEIPEFISELPPKSRIVHHSGEPICTFAYAVSNRGAKRVLHSLAVKELQGLFDNALAWMCRDKPNGVKCMSVFPSLFYQHRSAGLAGKNSDNLDTTSEVAEAYTDHLQWPVKMNFEKLLQGETDFTDQYTETTGSLH